MAAEFPGAIKTFRTISDLPGIVYDADQETTVFAKDTNDLFEEVVAIETALGPYPYGGASTVGEAFDQINNALGAFQPQVLPVGYLLQTDNVDYSPADYIGFGDWTMLGATTLDIDGGGTLTLYNWKRTG